MRGMTRRDRRHSLTPARTPLVAHPAPRTQGARLSDAEKAEVAYHLELVRLLATCCEGENRYIESMCQNIFSVHDLLPVRAPGVPCWHRGPALTSAMPL